MQLNQATDYAFRIVLHLACLPSGQVVNGQMLAEQENIPQRFLLKIMRSLTQAGLIKSYRGTDGGFALARPPEEITIWDVICAMEGEVTIHRCLADRTACNKHCAHECPVHAVLGQIQAELAAALRQADFATLASRRRTQEETEGKR
ncbi:RrF2 family transcriptional regulator [Sporolituus thermophilus]|uniref:Transcriptional regulator, BadM/Rrf2 family n=1 Tax=Sporolituus thermophilus DSM 23256 TaxID=1123285 RepID=A0A1G7MKF8_9FIRM|nr:Rrf2 family transcriptional regulator [Sporolituus thermophilus]SDF62222.1 transcriptional regulator, BadM/Rrf2 family [Sporolituus thermophilus DSM 23256]